MGLHRAAPFTQLSPDACADIVSQSTLRRTARGEVLFDQGQEATSLFAILTGKVKLVRVASDGRQSVIDLIPPFTTLGTVSVFDNAIRCCRGVAVDDTTTLEVPIDIFLAHMTADPASIRGMIRLLATSQRRRIEGHARMVFSDVPGRVAGALMDLADAFGQAAGQSRVVQHGLTQQELAEFVGASRETVNKVLADFTRRGWIDVSQRAVTVREPDLLAARSRL